MLIIQSDAFRMMTKTLVALIGCPVEDAAPIRVTIEPDATNNLRRASDVMVDAILPVRPEQFGRHIGRLGAEDMRRVEQGLLIFLGIGT